MTKELIRNGGFERGNLDFWVCEAGSVEIVSDVKKRGSYAAKIKVGGSGYGLLSIKDLIPVSPFEVYKFTGWLKSTSWNSVHVKATFYDTEYSYISGADMILFYKTGTFEWTFAEQYFIVPIEASYIVLIFKPTGSADTYGYIDSISLQRLELANLGIYYKELISKTNFTSIGTFYGDYHFSGIWKQAEFLLDVNSLSGSSPTLDVTIEAFDPITNERHDIAVFDQMTTTGKQVKIATAGLGWQVRVKFTTGGSITDCDFVVSAIFKR